MLGTLRQSASPVLRVMSVAFMFVVLALLACIAFCVLAHAPWLSCAFADESSSSSASTQGSSRSETSTAADPFKDAVKIDKSDGLYLVDVTLSGGSGKATVESPAELEVFDGRAVVQLVWSSEHYDYMIVNGVKYLPVNKSGNSTFAIPVLAFDNAFTVVADTTAMGSPHEISYSLNVKLDSVKARESSQSVAKANTQQNVAENRWPWIVFAVCAVLSVVCIAAVVILLHRYRNQH